MDKKYGQLWNKVGVLCALQHRASAHAHWHGLILLRRFNYGAQTPKGVQQNREKKVFPEKKKARRMSTTNWKKRLKEWKSLRWSNDGQECHISIQHQRTGRAEKSAKIEK